MDKQLAFRFATEKDVPLILKFIKGIAEYEKMLDEVETTEELLHEYLFEKQRAEVIFAIVDNIVKLFENPFVNDMSLK